MRDQSNTKQALIGELASLKRRIAELEQTEPKRTPVDETVHSLMRLIDAAPDSITVHDFDGNFLYANQKTFELHGYTREEFLAATLHDINVPESEELIASRMQQILETGEASFEVSHFRKDGSSFPLIVHARIGNWNEVKVIFSIASDITERKRKEDELQKISKLLAETQAITKVGGWEYDVANGRIKWTDEVYRIYGVGRDYDPSNVNRAISFYAPEDAAVIERAFRQAMESGEPYDLELGFMRANGERIWVRTIGRPFIEDGKVVRIAGNFMDITERKRIEEALRESEDCYKRLVEGSPDIIWSFSDKSGTLYTSARVQDILGYSPDYLYQNPGLWNESIHPDDRGLVSQAITDFAAGKDLDVEYRIKNAPGDWLWFHDRSIGRWMKGSEVIIDGISTHITERKQAEEALRAANAYNRSLIEASIDPLVTISPDGKITDVNAATERVTGYANNLLIGTDFSNYFSKPEMARAGYRRVFTEGHVRDYPLEIRHCDGHVTPVLYNATLYCNEKGEVSGIFAAARDITERKLVEAKLRASLREKDILLDEIHHRVKNNMQVISGLFDLQSRASRNPEVTKILKESQDRIRSMALVHEKLYHSRDFSRINLAGYVRSLSQELFQSHNINRGEIDLTIQADGEVYVDIIKAIPCGLIMNELITNALKHAFPRDRTGKLQIIISETKNTEIEIVIRDNGVGLPHDVDLLNPRSVGLHLVNGLVKNQLDGQIEVRRDNGTEFRIIFPL